MFAGIIRATVPVLSIESKDGNINARIETPDSWKLELGQSIAIDGVCSTATEVSETSFSVDWMPETIAKTTVGDFREGRVVNLERSLTLQDFVDGHLVQGHVDTRTKVTKIVQQNGATTVTVHIPESLEPFVAQKGSICINGVSLTVAEKPGREATVALIPYTLEHTNLGLLKTGDEVNIEVDMIARYAYNYYANKK